MRDLKSKLREIKVWDNLDDDCSHGHFLAEEDIDQIIACFKEDGWVQLPTVKDGDVITVNAETYLLTDNGITKIIRLTGQQFYDRFEEELLKHDWGKHSCGHIALESAKRAAGIKEDE